MYVDEYKVQEWSSQIDSLLSESKNLLAILSSHNCFKTHTYKRSELTSLLNATTKILKDSKLLLRDKRYQAVGSNIHATSHNIHLTKTAIETLIEKYEISLLPEAPTKPEPLEQIEFPDGQKLTHEEVWAIVKHQKSKIDKKDIKKAKKEIDQELPEEGTTDGKRRIIF